VGGKLKRKALEKKLVRLYARLRTPAAPPLSRVAAELDGRADAPDNVESPAPDDVTRQDRKRWPQ
jgi:hypothetical protein